ncbi:hypothetical protein WJX81_005473 [Elliptochloris bilobata]|uniref:Protein kinase domain-containing protein n=1 Tax=Elliptochloris bilobata TaxID=381761 RepID=A0AAW1RU75_9CHLO
MRRGSTAWSIEELEAEAVLGEGAMSTVALCVCKRSGLRVALKMYHKSRMSAANYQQAEREICIQAALRNEHTIALYVAFEDEDGVYLVQEYAAGGDVYGALAAAGGFLHETQVADAVVLPLLRALSHLHSQAPPQARRSWLRHFGVAHRDVKSENLLLCADASGGLRVRLADFGLAERAGSGASLCVGTLDYMAPEVGSHAPAWQRPARKRPLARPLAELPPSLYHQMDRLAGQAQALPAVAAGGRAHAQADPDTDHTLDPSRCKLETCGLAGDVWAAGVLAYEMLLGGPPFEADTKAATYAAILHAQPWLPQHLSAPARDFLLQALTKDPTQRPTAGQLLHHPWLAGRSAQPWGATNLPNPDPAPQAAARLLHAPSLAPATPPRQGPATASPHL